MSLTSSLLIGRSALVASQAAIQVTGDNIANAATPGYNRRVVDLSPARGSIAGRNIYLGRGVEIEAIRRVIDPALLTRIQDSTSSLEASLVDRDVLSQIENLTTDLDGGGLAGQLSEFFNSFSELANNPSASETRALIVEQGASLASFVRGLRADLTTLRSQVEAQIGANVDRADELLGEIASLNVSISNSEEGRGENAGLRDQREALLTELSTLIDINVVEQASGTVDVHVGSTPIVLGNLSRGLEVNTRTINGEPVVQVTLRSNGDVIEPTSGRIGALLAQRNGPVADAIDDLDDVASALIFEVNRLHSSGRSFPGLTDTTGWLRVPTADQGVAFNDPANATFAALPHRPVNGSFTVLVTDGATGLVEQRQITIDLDGIDNTGAVGFGDDTSLNSLLADLNTVPNLTATLDASGRLRITASPGFEVGFADDTSGALGVLGINSYFTGLNAGDIGVRDELKARPELLVAGVERGGNNVALSIAALRDSAVDSLSGTSITESWRRVTERVAVQTRAAGTEADAANQVKQSLEAQRAAISGVSIDEESINLLSYQRQYQAAARLISTVDQLTQELLSLV